MILNEKMLKELIEELFSYYKHRYINEYPVSNVFRKKGFFRK